MLARALVVPLIFISPRTAERLTPSAFTVDKSLPRVVSLEPAHLDVEVDAKKTVQLVVTFDRAMNATQWSFCGGGPNYPVFKGKPRWESTKKIVVDVELEPNHDYELALNCPAATKFQSARGDALVPVPWSFATLPATLPDPAAQKVLNQESLDALQKLLAESYSYYDLRVRSWDKLVREHEAAIVGAKTNRGFASAAARMLAATEDIHLYLRLGDRTFATGTRAVDPLYRSKLVPHYVSVQPAGERCSSGRTDDGIGYVMIAEWSDPKDVEAVEEALASLRDCRAMIVDVRPNSGGDELLARRVAAWFVDGTKVYAKNRYRVKPGKDGYGPVFERSITGNAEPEKRITAPIAVLTSRYVMSSNESFVLMMRQAERCTVVGQTTYGSSGNPKPHELPNGVTVVVPSWQDLRPDGTCFEVEGLAPDVEVDVDAKDLEEKDPILERALALLRDEVGRAGKKAR